jgi:hypothetical protein
VAAGGYFSLARLFNGSVMGWGSNSDGQLTLPSALTQPFNASGLASMALAAGGYHAFALVASPSQLVGSNTTSVLLAIRNELGSPPGLSGWGQLWPQPCRAAASGQPYVDARGILCSSGGEVVGLELDGLNITPRAIPPSLALLTGLRSLSLSNTPLTGGLPASLTSLTGLTRLTISLTSVSGPLPPSYSALTGLVHLDLAFNGLVGGLPPQWSSLADLAALHLSYNALVGPIPPEWVEGMGSIDRVALEGNGGVCGGVPGVWAAGSAATEIVASLSINSTCTAEGTGPPYDVSPVYPRSPTEAALSELRTSIMSATAPSTALAAIFDTWFTNSSADVCSNATCRACTLKDAQCGVWDTATNTSVCAWRYVGCANGTVTAVDFGATWRAHVAGVYCACGLFIA